MIGRLHDTAILKLRGGRLNYDGLTANDVKDSEFCVPLCNLPVITVHSIGSQFYDPPIQWLERGAGGISNRH